MNNIQQAENTASIQPFMNDGGAGNNPGGDSPERNLPSELRHRPKIPRTPNRADRPPQATQQNDQNIANSSMNNNSINLPQVTKNGKPLSVIYQ